MDRQHIINTAKETLLTATTLPTAFFVDCKDKPLQTIVPVPCPCGQCEGIAPPSCFQGGRQIARELQWNLDDISEMGFVTIEKQGGKEELVIAFCEVITPDDPVFTQHRIEIRRRGENIALLDNEESTSEEHCFLRWFGAGVMTSTMSAMGIISIIAALEAGR